MSFGFFPSLLRIHIMTWRNCKVKHRDNVQGSKRVHSGLVWFCEMGCLRVRFCEWHELFKPQDYENGMRCKIGKDEGKEREYIIFSMLCWEYFVTLFYYDILTESNSTATTAAIITCAYVEFASRDDSLHKKSWEERKVCRCK